MTNPLRSRKKHNPPPTSFGSVDSCIPQVSIKFLIALLGAIFVSGAATAKPNVVVVLTDDQDDTGSMAYMPQKRFSPSTA
jgi:hypothetical protein